MEARLFVATRKGLFVFQQDSTSVWKVKSVSFLGDSVSLVLPNGPKGYTYAALNLGHFGPKLRRSKDCVTWEECATPTLPESDEQALSVEQIWSLVNAVGDSSGLWAGTIPGALFYSSDGGDSWSLNESLWNCDERKEWVGGGYSKPGIHSICPHPSDPNQLSIAVSVGGVWTSMDAGDSWNLRAKGMRAEYMPPDMTYTENAQDPHCMVRSPANPDRLWVQHHNGIFVSSDNAASWQEIEDVAPSTFGFAVAAHPSHADTAWFVPATKDETRVPVDGRLVVTRTRDGGKHFDVLRQGLPQEHAYDLIYRHALDVDSSGKTLAIGSTTGGLWVSTNQGDSWQQISVNLPPIYCVKFS